MSNIRIGGRTYRNVEKMSAEELSGVAKALLVEYNRIGKQLRPLEGNTHVAATATVGQANVLAGTVQIQLEILDKRRKQIESLLKQKGIDV